MKVYTDHAQCGLFGAQYFGLNEVLVTSTEALLKSKGGDGYDKAHKELLEPFKGKTLVLQRTEGCGPGWWEIVKAL